MPRCPRASREKYLVNEPLRPIHLILYIPPSPFSGRPTNHAQKGRHPDEKPEVGGQGQEEGLPVRPRRLGHDARVFQVAPEFGVRRRGRDGGHPRGLLHVAVLLELRQLRRLRHRPEPDGQPDQPAGLRGGIGRLWRLSL